MHWKHVVKFHWFLPKQNHFSSFQAFLKEQKAKENFENKQSKNILRLYLPFIIVSVHKSWELL